MWLPTLKNRCLWNTNAPPLPQHNVWSWPLTWILIGKIHSSRTIYPTGLKLLGKAFYSIQLHKVWETPMTFGLDHWPTDPNINGVIYFIKDYWPTTFEASGPKSSWIISCTKCGRPTWPLTLTFDLLTWISRWIIYSSRTIYLPSLNLLEGNLLELSVEQG